MPQFYLPEYTPHPGQLKLHTSQSKEILVVSSIRAGKSFGVMHDAMASAWNNPTGFGTLITAPTYKLVESVLERPIVSKFDSMGLIESHSFSRHETTLKNGKIIYFRSLEEPDGALRGLNINKAYVDEAAYCSKYAVDLVKGRLLTTNGQLIMITTPNGQSSWMYEDYIAELKDYVDYIKFNLRDNPLISEEAIERLYQSYDPLLAKQELEGEWVNLTENQVYYMFSDDNIGDYPLSPREPVYVGLDFNIDKNAWAAFQRIGNHHVKMIKEGYGAKTTADAAQQIQAAFPNNNIIIVPDATGGNRVQGVATTQFQLLRQAGLHTIIENRRNPDRAKRYAVTNAALKNALDEVLVHIDKSCVNTIRELRELSYKEGTDKIDDQNQKRGHRTDSFSYAVVYLFGNTIHAEQKKKHNFVEEFKKQALMQSAL